MSPTYSSEMGLVTDLRKGLEEEGKFKQVLDRTNLSKRGFERFCTQWWPGTREPLAKEIDLLLVNEKHELIGIEVKYFRSGTKYFFLEGLGQALGYLSLGFDRVQLWHFYDTPFRHEQVVSYIGESRGLIQNLNIPIAYLPFEIREKGKATLFYDVNSSSDVAFSSLHYYMTLNKINADNRLLHYSEISETLGKRRKALMAFLQIPQL